MSQATKQLSPPPAERMQCLEVLGTHSAINRSLRMTGVDAWLRSEPHAGAHEGGDLCFLSSCASGRISRLLLADVSGHGAGVSELAAVLARLLRKNINRIDQRRLVKAINQEFEGLTQSGAFATFLVATIYAPTGRLTVSSAGHPPPMLYRAQTRRWSLFQDPKSATTQAGVGFPLGISPDAEYDAISITLAPGDRLLCYTDCLIEAQRKDERVLGVHGLLRILNELADSPAEETVPRLIETIEQQDPAFRTRDDFTIALLMPSGSGIPLKNNLLALPRIAASWLKSLTARSR